MREKAKEIWGYFSEVLLAALIVTFFCVAFGTEKVSSAVGLAADSFSGTFFGVLFAASFALLWSIFTKVDSKFYVWLASIGALDVYLRGMMYAVLIELIATVAAVSSKWIDNETFRLVFAFLMSLGAVNGITMAGNALGLMRLNALFEKLSK